MSRVLYGILLGTSLTAISQIACAQGFEGLYIGAKAGYNNSSAFGYTRSSKFAAGEAGYNVLISGHMLLGADLWGDDHRKSLTGRDWGGDAKLGYVDDSLLYYVKLGAAATHPGTRVHYGWGLEYKFSRHWGGLLEWTGDSLSKDSTTYQNNNLVLGATLHF